ncbi:MAG: UDP-N-acetylmuramate dehydrogenase [Prevotella sp.]|nr:UDP-N-acetylmuramate dehydrogenase [Prevotella sp.]
MRDERDYSLKAHNTFGIEAKCERFIEFTSVEEAQQVAKILRESELPYIIIGGGSNLLLTKDYPGIVVRSTILGIQIDDNRMTCGSGEVFDEIVEASLMAGLYGLENLSLIPGDVGASAVQNIGAYGVEAKDYIESIEAVEISTGKVVTILAKDCGYGYRQSKFKTVWKNQFLITHVTYRLSTIFEPHLEYGNLKGTEGPGPNVPFRLREVIIGIRNEKLPDPKVMGNAGSFFMNPIVPRATYEALAAQYPNMPHYEVDADRVKIPAGWMIDQCGWKGKTMGRAGVHEKQALVLVNLGGATGEEIVRLCHAIQKDVKEKFGIEIHPEVNIV